jgi:hypothetical protein
LIQRQETEKAPRKLACGRDEEEMREKAGKEIKVGKG